MYRSSEPRSRGGWSPSLEPLKHKDDSVDSPTFFCSGLLSLPSNKKRFVPSLTPCSSHYWTGPGGRHHQLWRSFDL
ncbi:hypothetical protein GW17_00047726 [Ensete ventricosum]|nr:hypothetical protein GW17_00047726 [Ensete ventricosum]RZS16994.1 hypothetical protein BHM03_00049088 [Ensete ventricosum]